MSRATISSALAALVGNVEGVGQVHERERWSDNWTELLEQMKADGRINSIMFSRRTTTRRQRTVGEVEVAHVFGLRLVYSFSDVNNSEADFQSLVDRLETAVLGDETIGDSCETTHPDWGPMNGAVGLQIDVIEPRIFGKTLCHVMEGRICALESVAV